MGIALRGGHASLGAARHAGDTTSAGAEKALSDLPIYLDVVRDQNPKILQRIWRKPGNFFERRTEIQSRRNPARELDPENASQAGLVFMPDNTADCSIDWVALSCLELRAPIRPLDRIGAGQLALQGRHMVGGDGIEPPTISV